MSTSQPPQKQAGRHGNRCYVWPPPGHGLLHNCHYAIDPLRREGIGDVRVAEWTQRAFTLNTIENRRRVHTLLSVRVHRVESRPRLPRTQATHPSDQAT